MIATITGDDTTRQQILDTTMSELSAYLVTRQKGQLGLDMEANETVAYHLILAEVDQYGKSLPLLLRWFEIDVSKTGGTQALNSWQQMTSNHPVSLGFVTEPMQFIGAGAMAILERVSPTPPQSARPVSNAVWNAPPTFEVYQSNSAPPLKLQGHLRFPDGDFVTMKPAETMARVREYLQRSR